MSDITWCLKPLIGFRRVPETGGPGSAIWVPGDVLALRKNGDELLFAATPELPETVTPLDVPKEPLAWIQVTDFSANPLCLNYAEDFVEEEDLPTIPAPSPMPKGPRRRGGD